MKVPSLESAKAYIDQLNFSQMIEKMVFHQGWLEKDAIAVSELYRDFLWLQKKHWNQHEIVPTEEVDEFWHNHVLDTRKYHEDCKAIFGEYFHHYPYFGIDEASDLNDLNAAFENTLSLYVEEFGHDKFACKVRTPFSILWGKIQPKAQIRKKVLQSNVL